MLDGEEGRQQRCARRNGRSKGPSPRQLEAKGWGRDVSKAGDKVTFEGRPRRDGQPELLLLSVTLADGKTFSFKPE